MRFIKIREQLINLEEIVNINYYVSDNRDRVIRRIYFYSDKNYWNFDFNNEEEFEFMKQRIYEKTIKWNDNLDNLWADHVGNNIDVVEDIEME